MNLSYFKEKVCVITGSTQGIGRETARIILENGGNVTFNGRSLQKEEIIRTEFKAFRNQIHYVAGNIGNPESSKEIIHQTIARFGKLDVLINNGGMSSYGEIRDLNPNVIREIIDSNLGGALYMSHFAISQLMKTSGNLLFISSLAGLHGIGKYAPYSSVKMAYTAIAQSLRKELNSAGVHVGVSYVGFTENDPEKKALNAKGGLESIPKRGRAKVYTQRETAMLILKQIINRKPTVVQSNLGRVLYFLNRLSPELVHRILLKLNKED